MQPASLIEALPQAAWLVDPKSLCIVAANAAAGALLRCDSHALIGMPVLALAATPEDEVFWSEAAAGRANAIDSETLMLRRDNGATLQVSRRVRLLATGAGGPVFLVALQDNSAKLRAQGELEVSVAELQATLESAADGILVTDLAGRIRNVNRRCAALWNIPHKMLLNRDDDALLDWMRHSVVDAAAYMRRLAALEADTVERCVDLLPLKSGRVLERVTQPLLTRGLPNGRVYSFRDVAERAL